jgi:SAM-dependent methyltransferase
VKGALSATVQAWLRVPRVPNPRAPEPVPNLDGFVQADYWRRRHKRHEGDPRSVGNLGRSVAENLESEDRLRRVVDRAAQLLAPATTVLDLGCGYGRTADCFAHQGYTYLGVDVSATAVAQARRRTADCHFVVADLATWHTEDTFDVVCALYFFSTFVDDQEWAASLETSLQWVRTGGALLIAEQFSDERMRPAPHVVARPLSDFVSLAGLHGFAQDERFIADLRGSGDDRLPEAKYFCLLRRTSSEDSPSTG